MTRELKQSLALHLMMGATFVLVVYLLPVGRPARNIKIRVEEIIRPSAPAEPPVVAIAKPVVPPPASAARRVFGLNKNTLTSDGPGAVEVKAGNTLAKDIDQEKLRPEDEAALPVPTEEYLVSQMPRLKSEVRIPYPESAKAGNIQGVVVMDILIDAQGRVRQAVLIEGPGHGLNEAALSAIYKFEFAPAVVDTKPVAVKIRYAYRFVLN